MFAISLLTSAAIAVAGFSKPEGLKDAQSYLNTAIENRRSIETYDLSAEIVHVESDATSDAKVEKRFHYRIVFNGTATRIDCKVIDSPTGQIEADYSLCEGMIAEPLIVLRDRKANEMHAFSKDDPRARLLINPLMTGFAFRTFEDLDRQAVSFDDCVGKASQPHAFDLHEEPKLVRLRLKPGTRKESLAIHFDPLFNGNVTRVAYESPDGPVTSFSSTMRYATTIKGIYFPFEVELSLASHGRKQRQTITFHTLHFNEPIDSELLLPASFEWTANTPVIVKQGQQSVVRYFDGETLRSTPGKPANPPVAEAPAQPPGRSFAVVRTSLFLAAIIAVIAIVYAIVKWKSKKGPNQYGISFQGSDSGP